MAQVNVALAPLAIIEKEGRDSAARASAISLDRRRNPSGARTQIKELRSRHQAILRLDLAGLTQREIAPIVGLTPQMVCVVQNSDIYRAEKVRLAGAINGDALNTLQHAAKRLEKLCNPSIDVIEEVLLDRGTAARVRANVAFEILDRNGLKPPERHEHVHTYDSVLLDAYRRRKEALVAVGDEAEEETDMEVETEYATIALAAPGPGSPAGDPNAPKPNPPGQEAPADDSDDDEEEEEGAS